MRPTKSIWFIRHGESVSNANLPTKHPANSELTAKGLWEAEQVAAAFIAAPDLIVVSPYIRARQTARPTQNRFPNPVVDEWPVHEFSYLHPEKYNGTTGSQRGPWAQAYWDRQDPHEKEGNQGESFAQLMARVAAMENRLHHQSASFIAIFSHGLFLRAFVWMHLTGIKTPSPQAMASFRNFIWGVRMPNCAILRAEISASGLLLGSMDISHLRFYPQDDADSIGIE